MSDLKLVLEEYIRKRKTGFGEFVYVYLPTNTTFPVKKNVFDTLVADVDTYSKITSAHKPEALSTADFETNLKLALSSVGYENEMNGGTAHGGGEEGQNEEDKEYNKEFSGPMSAALLRRKCRVNAISTEGEKVMALLEAVPKVEKVEATGKDARGGKLLTFNVTFEDAAACKEFAPQKLKCSFANLKPTNSHHEFIMRRPSLNLGNTIRRTLMFAKRYVKGFASTGELEREVLVRSRGEYLKAEKMKEFLLAQGVADVERVRTLYYSTHAVQVMILFKSKESADKFIEQAASILLPSTTKTLEFERCSELSNQIDRFSKHGIHGDSKVETRDKMSSIYVQLYDEGLANLQTIKKFFEDEAPDDVLPLSPEISRILSPQQQTKPVLLVSYPSKEKAEEVLLKLDDMNENKTTREWVYAKILDSELKDRKRLFINSEVQESEEECKEMFDVKDDSITFRFKKAPPKQKQGDGAHFEQMVPQAVNPVMNFMAPMMNLELGEWVHCSLIENPSQVKWDPRDSQEIGRYFFENHANVLEIKMKGNKNVVYVRFRTIADAQIFSNLAYALFLGVAIRRIWFPLGPTAHCNDIRLFLGGAPFVKGDNKMANGQKMMGGETADTEEEKMLMTFTGFKEKSNNATLFPKLEELGVQRSMIVSGMWEKIKTGDKEGEWISKVLTKQNVTEVEEAVLRWNQANTTIGDAKIEAELSKVEKKVKNNNNRRGNKRSGLDTANSPNAKKSRNFLENY